jgi:histidine triad (HIT) family protein
MNQEDCIFCSIIKGKIPSAKVYEDENVLAFLDIAPFNQGHTIVVPKEHYNNILDFPDQKINGFFTDLKKIAGMLKKGLKADGFNILQNNFPAAGQVVNHMHYHIIPRWNTDKVPQYGVTKNKATPEELNAVLEKIKKT